ncbi:LuxR family transcriptional regulator [Shinella sp. CPCC 101442]|uniref:helix-turn-helix transcriptional regulator n=1 Tax=Shinella sp. CPCC 101442 TaxID=2932265 RepID=UPI002152CB33|nr:LuxR family transcriptional regulator [Shinella sp. CPCC 101442]MCR6502049.1 LuxR family transcriptional regulator [Shinella sp. CPCC 101442]
MKHNAISEGLDKTLSFLSEIKQINTLPELTTAAARATAEYGVKRILAGYIPRSGMLPNDQLRHVLLADWPEQWADIYFHNGFLFHDPTIRRVLNASPTFSWSELSKAPDVVRNERLVMDRAKDFHLGNGCTVPLVALDGRKVGFSFAGAEIDDAPDAKGVMTLIATFAFGRAIELQTNAARASAHLTPREREVIAWISAGKTDWEISKILGVSEAAIAKHIFNVRMKLGAMNRAHAVAEAFRAGLIT